MNIIKLFNDKDADRKCKARQQNGSESVEDAVCVELHIQRYDEHLKRNHHRSHNRPKDDTPSLKAYAGKRVCDRYVQNQSTRSDGKRNDKRIQKPAEYIGR